jgi:CDGSH-type Zn-finger protein
VENRIKVRQNGPLLCTGSIAVYDSNGNLLEEADDLVLCRCGQSRNKPFCDGSHRDSGFESDGIFAGVAGEPLEEGGPLTIAVRPNAMLVVKGPVTIVSADGTSLVTRNKAALCRCGHSGNKPFCDATHKQCAFEG